MPLITDESLPPNYQQFPDGSILRIVFHNFLTYEHTCFVPTQNLNMILGHNGSGKSSIICGICLACGGSPKTLGRSEKISDYIRHGCQEGYVEMTIADEQKGPQTVRLTLRIGKSPEYRLNNAIASQTDIYNLRKHYNIQIDNPCAFLAQDKVKSFSEQSAIELLRNTEKAASDDLDQIHRNLIEQRQDSTTIEDKCASSEKAVLHLENEITKIMPLVENYRKKLALQSKLKLLEKKKKVIEYQEAMKEYQEEKLKADDACQEYREVEGEIEACEKQRIKLQERIRKERTIIQETYRSASGILAEVQDKTDKTIIEKELKRAKQRLDSAKNDATSMAKNIENTRDKLKHCMSKLEEAEEDCAGYDEFQQEYRLINDECWQMSKKAREMEDAIAKKVGEVNYLKRKINQDKPDNRGNLDRRLYALKHFNPHAEAAWRYYLANKDNFKGPVYLPMIHLTLKTAEASKLLENSFGMRDRVMFVCTHPDDERILNNDSSKWRINTSVVYPEKVYNEDINATLPDELKDFGFKCFISETIDAPGPLKQYICNVSGIHRIPYGPVHNDRIEEASNLLLTHRMEVFITPQRRYQVQRSEYSRKSIQTSSTMRPGTLFEDPIFRVNPLLKPKTDTAALERIEALEKEIKEDTAKAKEMRFDATRKSDSYKQQQLEWRAKKAQLSKWNTDITVVESQLKQLQNHKIDVDSAEKEYKRVEQTVVEKTKRMLQNIVQGQKEYLEKYREAGRRTLIETMCKAKNAKLIIEANTHREKLNSLKDMKNLAEDQVRNAMNKKKVATNNLVLECELKHLNEEKMNPTEKTLWQMLNKMFEEADVPTDMDELVQSITNEKTRLKLAEDSGEDGSQSHEQKLDKLKVDLATETAKREKLIENRENLHNKLGSDIDSWREGIEKMIEQINENYVKFFEFLGCRGEVSLDVPENPLDIEKYGIMIMVCFRKGEIMKRLDNRVQSGGERSVATMLYLLALQQLCPVPFRCIDEINQGMDPTNERKVFEIMVGLWNGTAGSLSKTQYFLLSPKLLHGLDMRDNVNIILANSTLEVDHRNYYQTNSKLDAVFAELGINA